MAIFSPKVWSQTQKAQAYISTKIWSKTPKALTENTDSSPQYVQSQFGIIKAFGHKLRGLFKAKHIDF